MMKHYVKAISCDAVQWDGTNFREVVDFVEPTVPISWDTEEMYWEDDNIPSDLKLYIEYDRCSALIPRGYYVAKVYGKGNIEIFSDTEMREWSVLEASE